MASLRRSVRWRRSLHGVALAALLTCSGSLAAQGTNPPSQSTPTREEVLRGELDRQLRAGTSAVDVSAAFERAPCPLADERFADIKLTLTDVRFGGAEAVEPGLLDAAWQPYAGREIEIAAICEIRDRAAAILRDEGYVASVQVPVQTIDGGVVSFDVIVARLVSFVVRGDAGPSGRMVERYLSPLRGQPAFDTDEAERALLLARSIPGMDVRMVLARSTGEDARPGDLVGVVDVINRAFEADIAVQNYGSSEVGPWGGQARARFHGITGLADATELSVFVTPDFEEQLVVQGRHEFAVGRDGLRIGANAVHAWTHPDIPGDDLFEARTLVVNGYAKYPLLLRQDRTLDIQLGLDLIDQHIDFSDLPFSTDKLRVATIAADFSATDPASVQGANGFSISEPRWASHLRLELRKGMDIFGASEDCGPGFTRCSAPGVVPISRLNADPQGFVLRGQGEGSYRPSPLVTITARPRFQYSDDRLLPYEQISGGNFTAGRGFDPGAAAGDRGFGTQLEVAYGSLQPRSFGGSAWQAFAFYDTFAAWFADSDDANTLNSVGAGARINFRRRAYGEVLAAIPLEAGPLETRTGGVTVLVNFALRLGN